MAELEGAALFKMMVHGANFKWMELVNAGASQARIDAQGELAVLLRAVADKMAEIEAMEAVTA